MPALRWGKLRPVRGPALRRGAAQTLHLTLPTAGRTGAQSRISDWGRWPAALNRLGSRSVLPQRKGKSVHRLQRPQLFRVLTPREGN